METGDDLNVAVILVEFDRVLDQMEQDLLVEDPVTRDPVRNQIGFCDLEADRFTLEGVVEGRHEVSEHLAHGGH